MRVAVVLLALVWGAPLRAQDGSPSAAAESLRQSLLTAQMATGENAASALANAEATWNASLRPDVATVDADTARRIDDGFVAAREGVAAANVPQIAAARSQIWTGLLAGSLQIVEHAIAQGDGVTAQRWLPVREFRQVTRFTRPNANATLAVDRFAAGSEGADDATQAVHADLLDGYQSRLIEAIKTLADADAADFAVRRAELAGLAGGYFGILVEEYAAARGEDAAAAATQQFVSVTERAVAGESVADALPALEALLDGFRAAPLSPEDQARRAGQMMRFLSLVAIEYGRGIRNGAVAVDLEIRESITFRDGAESAFLDLRNDLLARNPELTQQAYAAFDQLESMLTSAARHGEVADPAVVRATTDSLNQTLVTLLPPQWSKSNSAADFDVIETALDQMEDAVAQGEYALAESARLEAYAILESGPEARLVAFAPQYVAPIEGLFWYGEGEHSGLASLLEAGATRAEVAAARAMLDEQLALAQQALGGQASPTAIMLNAGIIVFREGLEAVVILAALMASMVGARKVYRKPMAWGVVLAFIASIVTWWAMQTALSAFRGYGERLEAIVSLIAIAVLLLITNWFFHRVYWTDHLAELHQRKKAILGSVAAGQIVGFLTLGFTSVYREGFETVLFLQALILEAGAWTVIQGTLLGLAGVFLVGFVTFKLQSRLPYKDMLIVTGVLISLVLVVMVGNTVHILQLVGWMPLHPIRWLTLPYWMGMWFGIYPTWEGIAFQAAALAFVLGNYFVAERMEKGKPAPSVPAVAAAPSPQYSDAAAARIAEAKARAAKA